MIQSESLPAWGPYALAVVVLIYVLSVCALANLWQSIWDDPADDAWNDQ